MKTAAYETDQVLTVAAKLTNRSGLTNHHDREDLEQEIALAMWLAGERADTDRNVQGYQYKTGRGVALDTFNRIFDNNRRFALTLNQTVDMEGEGVDKVDTMGTTENPALAMAIDAAIDTLTEREAMVARRHLLEGETLTSIANSEGVTLATIHEFSDKAKAKLARRLVDWK